MTKSGLLTLLLVVWSLNLAASEVYYITTVPMDPSCPGPCLTLFQFARNTSRLLYPNTTLNFLPGMHYLNNTVLTISNVDNFAMLSENSTAYIACAYSSNFYFFHSQYVEISNLEFVACGGNQVKYVVEFVVQDTKFKGQDYSGTALDLTDTTTGIVNSTFVSNRRGSHRECVSYDPHYGCILDSYVGGAIIATNSTVHISLSKFYYNGADFGGAIFAEQQSVIKMSCNLFIKNSATLSGGALESNSSVILIEGNSFLENSPIRMGATVGFYYSTVTICGTMFVGQENMYSGTALSLIETMAEIVNSTFLSNIGGTYQQCVTLGGIHYGCVTDGFIGGAIIATHSTIDINQSKFEDNSAEYGGAIYIEWHSNISMSDNLFINNLANQDGGVLLSTSSTVIIETSEFHYNTATFGGVLYSSNSTFTISASAFHNNIATWNGGVLEPIYGSIVTIKTSEFHNNSARIGGVLRSSSVADLTTFYNHTLWGFGEFPGSTITIEASEFHGNTATSLGGVLYSSSSAITIDGSNFTNNSSPIGAVVYATNGSKIQHHNYLIIDNNVANTYAVIYLSNTEFKSEHYIFSSNLGSLVAFNTNLTFISNASFINNQSPKATTGDFQEGGAITLFQSNVFFYGTCNLEYNCAENGGAIHSTDSKICVNGNVSISRNTASKSGGGAYLLTSELNCQQKSTFILFGNSAAEEGGGLHAISSSIKATSSFTWPQYTGTRMNFTSNTAKRGGGLSLEANAILYILKYDSITYYNDDDNYHNLTGDTNTTIFITNSADYGGAVYVDDDSNSGTCASDPKTECFFQVLALYDNPIFKIFKTQSIYFSQNYATILGSTLYGGLLDRCAMSQFAEVKYKYLQIHQDNGNGIAYFKNVSIPKYDIENSTEHTDSEVIISTHLSIVSGPVRVCFCINKTHDCFHPSYTKIKKGGTFAKSLIAVNQIGQPVNATIQSSLSFADSGLAEGQLARKISAECTNLTFNIVSRRDSENLTLCASDGPCKDAELSRATVEVHFLSCSCPVGLQVSGRNETNCTCECHSDIIQYMKKCDSYTGSLVKRLQSRAWISYISNTDLAGYLIYPNCPFDYCLSTSPPINLNQPNGADAQCAFNRSSLFCGSCQPGLSLSLGSSRCLPCPSYWPALLVAITIAAILAGTALVTLLLVLNITVAVGTLNGLIFYANVVYANKSILFPFQETNFVTVCISWLNLELGIDTCYFPGMDTYIKTWLQLAFPAYVILLVVLVTVISSYSTKFSNLIGRKDPVATLATLILLSYAKLLEVCFKSLSVGILEYPDGENKLLWLPDATIKYLAGKHIPLFIAAVLILLVGLVYTLLLFSWQYILYLPKWRIFRWSRNPRIQTFIETYHTPYVAKHRYWTGLLLITRVVLYLIAAVNVSNEPTVALTAIAFSVGCIFLLKGIIEKRLYRKWSLEVLETFFLFNTLFFTLFMWYSLGKDTFHQETIAYTSVVFTIAVLLLTILYHMYTYTTAFLRVKKTKLGRIIDRVFTDKDPKSTPRLRRWSPPPDDDIHRFDELMDELECPVNTDDYNTAPLLKPAPVEPTFSVVELPKPRDLALQNPV